MNKKNITRKNMMTREENQNDKTNKKLNNIKHSR